MIVEKDKFIPYTFNEIPEEQMIDNSERLVSEMKTRRSIRQFSSRPVPREVIENIIRIASSAPSGANKQPWTFCAVSNPEVKKQIRERAEEEEFLSYNGRMGEEWLKNLEPFGTNHIKEFIEVAPYLLVVFKRIYDLENSSKVRYHNYYVNESVGIATGFLLSAIHQCGLVALTHTPSPMNFLHDILKRPENERPFMLIPVGYPAEGVMVPNIGKKSFEEVAVFFE